MLGAKSFTPKGSQLLPRTTAELQPLIANDPLLRVKKAGSNAEKIKKIKKKMFSVD